VEPIDALYARKPEWAKGTISQLDARYLHRRAVESGADTAVEIGTASGVSTAVLCHALSTVHDDFRVYSYDLRPTYYLDDSRAVGDAARTMLPPDLVPHITFRSPATAGTVAEEFGRRSLELVFIDANHLHPWPAFDLLTILDLLAPEAEVILHDINLPVRHPEHPHWGVKHVFDGLDARKETDVGHLPNIGSVWVASDRRAMRRQLRRLVDALPWECEIPAHLTTSVLGAAGRR
jgi:predicted O-methyltransferase YrrM